MTIRSRSSEQQQANTSFQIKIRTLTSHSVSFPREQKYSISVESFTKTTRINLRNLCKTVNLSHPVRSNFEVINKINNDNIFIAFWNTRRKLIYDFRYKAFMICITFYLQAERYKALLSVFEFWCHVYRSMEYPVISTRRL